MPAESDRIKEGLQKAASATLRALSEHPGVDVTFGLAPNYDHPKKIKLSGYARESLAYDLQLRGEADCAASRLRFHDQQLHAELQPNNYQAREFFDAFEQVRAECVSSQLYRGVKRNISDYYRKLLHSDVNAEHPPFSKIIQMLAFDCLGEKSAEHQFLAQMIHPQLPEILSAAARQLHAGLRDQRAFAEIVRGIIRKIGLEQDQNDEPDQSEDDAGESPSEDNSTPNQTAEQDQSQQMRDVAEPSSSPQLQSEAGDSDPGQNGEQRPMSPAPLPLSKFWETQGHIHYKAFTKDFDEVIPADQLCTPAELAALRASLDQYLSYVPPIVTRLANKLQRRLQAQQARSWNYDQEEGLIDPRRLPRLVTNPLSQNYYFLEHQTEFNDTVVTLLLDNSGSMRGRPIIIAALTADILARTLERCGVKVEILGFTTKSWKGGQPYEKWVAAGKPPAPGRLNDLRHIIYKSADQPWRRTKMNLGVMLREGLLKENIDGEALLWAHNRLMLRRESRRIMMVISDGAPVDDLTTSANGGIYLEQHLRSVIHMIEQKSPVELVAVGIGHDVTRYYENAVTIADVEQLGPVMLGQLGELFLRKQ